MFRVSIVIVGRKIARVDVVSLLHNLVGFEGHKK